MHSAISVWCIERYTKKVYEAALARTGRAAGSRYDRITSKWSERIRVQLIGRINVVSGYQWCRINGGCTFLLVADLVRRRGVRRRLAGGEASLVKHRSAHSTDARLGDYALRNTPRHKQHDVNRSGSPPDVPTTYHVPFTIYHVPLTTCRIKYYPHDLIQNADT